MNDVTTYLLGNAYSSFSPAVNTLAATCRINGQVVACPDFFGFFGVFLAIVPFVFFALVVVMIVSMWKIYTKANQPGWASIIPFYNMIAMLQMIKKPTWWVIFMFIPFANFIVGIIVLIDIAKVFGKGIGFTIGLVFLPFIFYPILAFGKSVYTAPAIQA
jgi:hypothetical protein